MDTDLEVPKVFILEFYCITVSILVIMDTDLEAASLLKTLKINTKEWFCSWCYSRFFP
jgi:hypothetical protein